MKRKKLRFEPAHAGHHHHGCLNCGSAEQETAPMGLGVFVGFGVARVTRDGEIVYSESLKRISRLARFEKIAAADPDHDWRLELIAPLSGRVYQRRGKKWVLIKVNMGFA
jgi:hypothetical protein